MTLRADRILLVLPSLERGGAERVMLQLARSFHADGREVHLAVLAGGGPLRVEVPEAVVLHELVDTTQTGKSFVLARKAFPRLVLLMRKLRPQAVLSTVTGTNILTVLACMGSRLRLRLALREAASTINAKHALIRWAMSILYRRADIIIAVSGGVADDLLKLGIPSEIIQVLHNPVDKERLIHLSRVGPDAPYVDGGRYIIALGRLAEQKGYSTLLRAYHASNVRSSHYLVIVGGGEQRAMLESMVCELKLGDRVVFTGALDNPFRILADAELLVLSSNWEGCPNVLLEALALGVPVVSTDCPHGPRELLENGKYGRLVPVNNPAALAHAMEAELAEPSPGADCAMAKHNTHSIASRYLSWLDDMSGKLKS